MIEPKKHYMILEHPLLGLPDLHKVKVLKIYATKQGKVVRYRYNWPFPITQDVFLKDFEEWVAK